MNWTKKINGEVNVVRKGVIPSNISGLLLLSLRRNIKYKMNVNIR